MKDLSQLLASVPPSATLIVSDKAAALQAQGKNIVALAGGDPNFDTPAHIVEAVVQELRSGNTHYPSPSKGTKPAVDAIAAKYERDTGLTINPSSQIIVTPGGKWALILALSAMLNPGDEVLYLEPVWVSYPPMITLTGGVPVPVSLSPDDNFKITAAKLREKITPKTKALMLTSPNNPTGRVCTQEEIDAVVEVANEHDLYVIFDELYEQLIYDGKHIPLSAEPGMAERTFIINGLSKAYAMTGWRLGWLIGPEVPMKLAAKMHSQTITAASSFGMSAIAAALNGPHEEIEKMRLAYKARRDYMVGALNEIDGIYCANIEGAFYLMPRFTDTELNSVQIAEKLLEAGVAGTPGIAFGSSGEEHLRFSIATSDENLVEAMERIAKFAKTLS